MYSISAFAQMEVFEPSQQEELSVFESVALIPLRGASSGQIETSYDPLAGVVTLSSTRPFRQAWVDSLPEQFGYQLHVTYMKQLDARTLYFRLESLASTMKVVKPGTRDENLVFGKQRAQTSVLPQHFFGEKCVTLFPRTDHHDLQRAIDGVCRADFRALHDFSSINRDLPAVQQQLVTLLYTISNPWDLESGVLHRYVRRQSLTPELRVSGMLLLALYHAFRDEIPASLDILDELVVSSEQVLESSDKRWQNIVSTMGETLFERLIVGSLDEAVGDKLRVISYYEDYRQWEPETLSQELKLRITQRYRQAHLYQRATQLYLELLARYGDEDVVLLEALARTYLEAGDQYRSYETLRFLMERHPSFDLPDDLNVVLNPPQIRRPVRACPPDIFENISGSYGPLAEIGCSLQRNELEKAIENAQKLQSPDHAERFQQIGRWWEEAMNWKMPSKR